MLVPTAFGQGGQKQIPGPIPTQRVNSAAELEDVLRSDFKGRVVVPKDVNWEMKDPCGGKGEFGECVETPITYVPIKQGVQLVGERGELGSRPALIVRYRQEGYPLFQITENDVRVEGIQIEGPYLPSERKQEHQGLTGIKIIANPATQQGHRIVIADNEISNLTVAVDVVGEYKHDVPEDYDTDTDCLKVAAKPCPHLTKADTRLVRIERNYLHNNHVKGGGYGIGVGGGSYAHIEGNVFQYNNHHIAADGQAYSGYTARFNYSLRGTLTNAAGKPPHTFDVHGRGGAESKKYAGGPAGTYFEIAYNTFLYEGDFALALRGTPQDEARFVANVATHDDFDEAVENKGDKLSAGGNIYDKDYSSEIATGDFDGDGRADVFVGNGTAWFVSRGGHEWWSYLRPSNKRVGDLGFADIDNDGRTDVIYRDDAGRLSFAKSGSAPGLTSIASPPVPVPISELRFGDFDGDRLTDMFYTHKKEWRVWYGKTRSWTEVNTSSKKVTELLFGEFDATPGTDVVGINGGGWAVSGAATAGWEPLNGKLSKSFSNAVTADVDGSRNSDIVLGGEGEAWRYSVDGRSSLRKLRKGRGEVAQRRVGRFFGPTQREGIVSFGYPNFKHHLGVWRSFGGGGGGIFPSYHNMR